MRFKSLIVASFISVVSLSAQAIPQYIFPLWDSTNTETISNSMQFEDGDLTMTVTAWTASFDSSQNQLEPWQQVTGPGVGVYRDEWGLGVVSSASDGNDLDGGSSSDYATDPDEGLLLVFNKAVSIFDIFVGDLDPTDDINFSLAEITPSGLSLSGSLIDISGPPAVEFAFILDPDFQGSAFMLWVDGGSDDVELLGVAANPIPAPATMALFATGLLLLVRRQRRA